MKHDINHNLDVATAKKVTDLAFEQYRTRFPNYEPNLTWTDDRRAEINFNAKGLRLHGSMKIAEKTISLELDVPFLFRPFQKRAIDVIEREVLAWIEKAREGKL
jgi:hypothetical protein